jgi:FHS family glucose/mannose:H+ symporter-like MFS transporter
VVIGGLQALYGPAIPAFREKFGVTPAVAGLGLSAEFTGALIGIVGYHLLARTGLRDRRLLAIAYTPPSSPSTCSTWPPPPRRSGWP